MSNNSKLAELTLIPPPSPAAFPPVTVNPVNVTFSPAAVAILNTRLPLSDSVPERPLASASVIKVFGSTMSLPSASAETTTLESPASIVTPSVICSSPNCNRMTSASCPSKTLGENKITSSVPGLSLAKVMASRRDRLPGEKSPSTKSILESTVRIKVWNSKAPMSAPFPLLELGAIG